MRTTEIRVVGQVTAAMVGAIVAACALSACISPDRLPHPEPQRAATPVLTVARSQVATGASMVSLRIPEAGTARRISIRSHA